MKLRNIRDILIGIAFLGGATLYVNEMTKYEPRHIYPTERKRLTINETIPSARLFDFNHNGRLDESEQAAYRENAQAYMTFTRQNISTYIEREIKDWSEESH